MTPGRDAAPVEESAATVPDLATSLSFLLGEHAGTERMHATVWAPAGTAAGWTRGRLEVGGTVVVQEQTQTRDGVESFRALNVFMVDPATAETLLYSFDSVGFPADPPARGRWQDGRLVLDRMTERGESRTTFVPSAGGYAWRKEFRRSADDTWAAVVDGDLVTATGTG